MTKSEIQEENKKLSNELASTKRLLKERLTDIYKYASHRTRNRYDDEICEPPHYYLGAISGVCLQLFPDLENEIVNAATAECGK